MKRIILIILLIALIGGGYYAYKLYSDQTPDIVDRKPDFTLTSAELMAAFEKDTTAAANAYLDKILEVEGQIKSVDTSGAILMGAGSGESVVRFGLDRRHMDDVHLVKPGNTAVFQGRLTGYEKGEEMLGISLGTTITVSFAGLKKK